MNHRFLALALAGTMTFGLLTACGGGNGDGISQTPDAVTTPPAVESTTPPPAKTAPPVEESPAALQHAHGQALRFRQTHYTAHRYSQAHC